MQGFKKLLKKSWRDRKLQPDAEAVSAADFSKTETLLDASVPADPPKEKNAEKPVRIKIKEAIGEHCDCPQIAVRQRPSSPINPAQSVSEKQTHLRMNLRQSRPEKDSRKMFSFMEILICQTEKFRSLT